LWKESKFGKLFLFQTLPQKRHPNATRFAAMFIAIIGNTSLKHDIASNEAFDTTIDHLKQAQHSESVIPTFADIDVVFDDKVLRMIMNKL
jgi:hypothetical protein